MGIKFIDCHCDTIVKCMDSSSELLKNDLHIDIQRLNNNVYIQTFAIWLNKKYYECGYKKTCEYIDFYYEQILKNNDLILPIYNYNDIINAKKQNKIGALLSIEGAEAIEGKIENLYALYKKGVRLMSLTWNYKNELGYGAGVKNEGLTDFGKEVVRHMERLNMVLDVSHLSDKGFWDVYNIARKPFIASHSNSREICNSKRNLTNGQIKAISDVGGLIGINLYSDFLSDGKKADINDVLRHIDHIISITDDNVLGFGCDYDGIDNTPIGLYDVSCVKKIICEIERIYGRYTAEKIAYKNFERVFSNII